MAVRLIRRFAPFSQILFFVQYAALAIVREAMRIGAAGYVCKVDAGRELVDAIHTVAEHERFLSASCAA